MSPFVSLYPFLSFLLFHFLFLCLSLVIFLASFLSVSDFCIWFLLFPFVFCFFVSRCSFVFFFCFLSCFILNHHVGFLFALHLVFWLLLLFVVLLALLVCCFLIFGNLSTNFSEKNGNSKNSKNEQCRKKRTL